MRKFPLNFFCIHISSLLASKNYNFCHSVTQISTDTHYPCQQNPSEIDCWSCKSNYFHFFLFRNLWNKLREPCYLAGFVECTFEHVADFEILSVTMSAPDKCKVYEESFGQSMWWWHHAQNDMLSHTREFDVYSGNFIKPNVQHSGMLHMTITEQYI